MIKLKAVISQLDEAQFNQFSSELKENKAEKFFTLLEGLRKDLSDQELLEQLNVNSSAYYTLKSRLFTKIQSFLSDSVTGSKADLIKNIATIPNLLFEVNRDTALAVLLKLEKDLLEYDMPYELTNVYNALKKLNLYSSKYFEYSQQYNKHVAYTIALDKSEDLLANYFKTLGEYKCSGDEGKLQLLILMKKEMSNLTRLYKSHHLQVYQALLDASFALFLPLEKEIREDEPIEDILSMAESVTRSFSKDTSYQYLSKVISWLYFEYYTSIGQHKKAAQYFDDINETLSTFLLYNFCAFPSSFLLSKLKKYNLEDKTSQLNDENNELVSKFKPEISDTANFIYFNLYLAASSFSLRKYHDSSNILNNLLNEVSFKNLVHAELEVKILLSLSYSMQNKYEQASSILRSASRKVDDGNSERYPNAEILIKMIKLQMKGGSDRVEQKLMELRKTLLALNKGDYPLLAFINFDDNFIKALSKAIK